MITCRKCGGQMQCTVEVYCNVLKDGLEIVDVPIEDARWYCENDHEAPADQADQLANNYYALSAFGREPGSGHLSVFLDRKA